MLSSKSTTCLTHNYKINKFCLNIELFIKYCVTLILNIATMCNSSVESIQSQLIDLLYVYLHDYYLYNITTHPFGFLPLKTICEIR